jgi:hypothetical protein
MHVLDERIALDVELGLRVLLEQIRKLVHVTGSNVALVRRGWTVMPCEPASRTQPRGVRDAGMPIVRVLRSVATLLMLTESLVTCLPFIALPRARPLRSARAGSRCRRR